jgi:anthranilate synthase/aminodeoxychorismate synthase-like glutamine amidotransferase
MEAVFIDHYDSFSFNLIAWLLGKDSGVRLQRIGFDDTRALRELQFKPQPLVLSPGPKAPLDATTSLELVQQWRGRVPILGVCLGHQILGAALGGRIVQAQHPFHGSLRSVHVRYHPPGVDFASSKFQATTYNSLVVDRASLEPDWVFAENSHGEVEGLYWQQRHAWPALGVQFHPESFLSEHQEPLRRWWWHQVELFADRMSPTGT